MEDDLEDRILYQTYVSHMKLASRLNVAFPGGGGHAWRLLRLYVLRPEVLVCGAVMLLVLAYLQAVDVWSRSVLGRLTHTLGRAPRLQYLVNGSSTSGERLSWELREGDVAAYAVQGRRPKMEDRFVVNDNMSDTGVALYAVFDGHGGEVSSSSRLLSSFLQGEYLVVSAHHTFFKFQFAANYAKEKLVPSLKQKLLEIKKLIAEGGVKRHPVYGTPTTPNKGSSTPEIPKKGTSIEKKNSFRKTVSASQTDECVRKSGTVTDPELLQKLDNIPRSITREVRPSASDETVPTSGPPSAYLDNAGAINYGRLLTDEVLAADHLLVEAAKKTMDVAGMSIQYFSISLIFKFSLHV